jgi:hypothetical protein
MKWKELASALADEMGPNAQVERFDLVWPDFTSDLQDVFDTAMRAHGLDRLTRVHALRAKPLRKWSRR